MMQYIATTSYMESVWSDGSNEITANDEEAQLLYNYLYIENVYKTVC